MAATASIISIKQLTKQFGGLIAVNNLELDIYSGSITSVIGPNGSGKTTFFNLISGMYAPTSGKILFSKKSGTVHDLVGRKPHEIVHLGVARTFQNLRLFPEMSVLENVMVGMHGRCHEGLLATITRSSRFRAEEERIRARAKELLAFFGEYLLPFKNESARNLSYANQRRLEIVRAMATEPSLLLLDEPAAGMNPTEKAGLMYDIRNLQKMEFTILLIEHDMMLVRTISDRVIAFDHGEKIADGTFDQVRKTPQVIEAYLGKGASSDNGAA